MRKNTSPRVLLESFVSGQPTNPHDLLLSAASLAPSTHNTQPWRVKRLANGFIVRPDLSKVIPEADPENRYLFISVGAFLGNMMTLLDQLGVSYSREFDENDHSTKITHELSNKDIVPTDASVDCVKNILSRQNYRGFFKEMSAAHRQSATKVLAAQSNLHVVSDKDQVAKLATLTATGLQKTYTNKNFRVEIAGLINTNWSKKRHGLHGHSLRMKPLQSLIIPKILKRKDIGAKLAKLNYASFSRSDFACLLATDSAQDKERSWVQAGIDMEKLFLELNKLGLSCSIYVASLEVPETLAKVKQCYALKKETPLVLFTVGDSPDTLPFSARKYLHEITES